MSPPGARLATGLELAMSKQSYLWTAFLLVAPFSPRTNGRPDDVDTNLENRTGIWIPLDSGVWWFLVIYIILGSPWPALPHGSCIKRSSDSLHCGFSLLL